MMPVFELAWTPKILYNSIIRWVDRVYNIWICASEHMPLVGECCSQTETKQNSKKKKKTYPRSTIRMHFHTDITLLFII